MLGLFDNALTSDDEHSRQNRGNFPQQTQMQLPQKQKGLSEYFIAFRKSK